MPGPGFKVNKAGINRNGRKPKGQTLTDILRKQADEYIDFEGNKLMRREILSAKLWDFALSSNPLTYKDSMVAVKYIYDRIDGKPMETLKVEDDKEDKLGQLIDAVKNKIIKKDVE